MDSTEKETAELGQSEPSDAESADSDQSLQNKKVKLSYNFTKNTESDHLDIEDADAEPIAPDDNTLETAKTDQPDSAETRQTDEKGDPVDHPPDDPDPQPNRHHGGEKLAKSSPNEPREGKGDDASSDADEIPPGKEAQDLDRPEPDDGDPETNEQPSQSSNGMANDERAAGDSVDEIEIKNHGQPAEPAVEHAELATDDADIMSTEMDLAAQSEFSDEKVDESDQQQSVSEEASTPPANTETASEADDDATDVSPVDNLSMEDQADSIPETAEPTLNAAAPRSPIAKIVVSAVLITALFSGFFIFGNKSKIKQDEPAAEAPSEDQAQPLKFERREIVDIPTAVTAGIYDDLINEVSALRDSLLKKQAEVLALKNRYQQSIEELEKEILDEQRKAHVQTFQQAINRHRIDFSLKTIQRRQAYIRQLEKPLEWVSGACEELLYLKRRVMTDLQVSAIASGIDMDRHVQQMHRSLKEYRPTADKLAIDPTNAHLESLETIWQQIQSKQNVESVERVFSKNRMISAQICAGDFSRINELSEMTAETAKCITGMRASDLFLNQITEMTPAAARQLCQWKGSWICMNGIRALSPRAAHYLFQWDGRWISLNGLTEFPAEIGEALLRWPGRQLELMGLLDTTDSQARIGIEYLAEWERSGGKLFVPRDLRKKIDALHQQSG
ncbi:MAG: hypothetical protein PVI55_00935 [Desulfobacterales bacterium]|jgi:hypothetical protein